MSTTYQQPVLPIVDPQAYGSVRSTIEAAFSEGQGPAFLRSLDRAGIRIRDFEEVLAQGLLGPDAIAQYARLGNNDQGQIREFYLASVERVAPELRRRFFKLYSYY